jgi:ABC-2 type transport system ATP-binding protein
MWERVRQLREDGVTVVLTTHDMDEAAEMSDRVGIVDHGRLLALDTPTALTSALRGQSVLEVTITKAGGDTTDGVIAALMAVAGIERAEAVADDGGPVDGGPSITLRLYVEGRAAGLLSPAVTVLTGRGAEVSNVHIGDPSLEDVFIDLTGRSLR